MKKLCFFFATILITSSSHARYSFQEYSDSAAEIITSKQFTDRHGKERNLTLDDADIVMSRGIEWLSRYCMYAESGEKKLPKVEIDTADFCESFLQYAVDFAVIANAHAQNLRLPSRPQTSVSDTKIQNTSNK